jgi:hypothetical protein
MAAVVQAATVDNVKASGDIRAKAGPFVEGKKAKVKQNHETPPLLAGCKAATDLV